MKALVTGGSRGIGAATARLLARAGADVAIGYRSRAYEAAEVASDCVAALSTAIRSVISISND
jgi:NAD(P)-dependent dehydrogenase (short-subunit alcohol dehydrogenase family)